jgi:hypothetical protein
LNHALPSCPGRFAINPVPPEQAASLLQETEVDVTASHKR